jgi:hypothetical protein
VKTSEAFPSNYLKAADLNGKAVKVTIESVSLENLGNERQPDYKPVMHFVGKEKALVLNRTNSNRIEEATGSDEMNDWTGWSITLYGCKVDFQGKRVDAIRVDDRPGAAKAPGKGKPKRAASEQAEPEPDDAPDFEMPPDADDSEVPF